VLHLTVMLSPLSYNLSCFVTPVFNARMTPIALQTVPGRRDPPLCIRSRDFFLVNWETFLALRGAEGRGGCFNHMACKAL